MTYASLFTILSISFISSWAKFLLLGGVVATARVDIGISVGVDAGIATISGVIRA